MNLSPTVIFSITLVVLSGAFLAALSASTGTPAITLAIIAFITVTAIVMIKLGKNSNKSW